MKEGVKPIPEGHHTLTPHLIVKGAAQAIDFYKAAFGAEEVCRMPGPDGQRLMHAELKVGDSHLFLCDEFPEMGALSPQAQGRSPVTLHLYVKDADAVFDQATAAGATVQMPLMDMFWGDRYGKLSDPFGHEWSIATHVEDVSPADMEKRAQEAFSASAQGSV